MRTDFSKTFHLIIDFVFFRPLFDVDEPYDRLAVGDAEYVECIHTNGGILGVGFGIGAPICDANFFPNGGNTQSGCLSNFRIHPKFEKILKLLLFSSKHMFTLTSC